jgi:hypothetical protein
MPYEKGSYLAAPCITECTREDRRDYNEIAMSDPKEGLS